MSSSTPWGRVQDVTNVAPGIRIVGTARHGGVVLSPGRVKQLPEGLEPFTGDLRYWEEDDDFYVPLVVFKAEFEAHFSKMGDFVDFPRMYQIALDNVRQRSDWPEGL
jgi:hypothetical protein